METLSQQHCYHHPRREAVVRCPACGRFFCRECVTEHDDRMLCSGCLAHLAGSRGQGAGRWRERLILWTQGIGGFLMIWYLFYMVGRMLLAIPHEFHEGTIWHAGWWRKL
jgi:hypothetical protein